MEKAHYFWLLLGLILMIAEVMTPGFILFFFGLAGILVGIACFIFPGISGVLQLILFAIFSVMSLLLLRRHVKSLFTGRSRNAVSTSLDDACVGRHALVMERIAAPHEGKVELDGVLWNATADEVLEPDTPVEITARDGLTLIVRRR